MKRTLMIASMIFFAVVMVFSTGGQLADGPGCIVLPEEVERCNASGGQYDWRSCSCMGGSANLRPVD